MMVNLSLNRLRTHGSNKAQLANSFSSSPAPTLTEFKGTTPTPTLSLKVVVIKVSVDRVADGRYPAIVITADHIVLNQARNLAAKDRCGTSDPVRIKGPSRRVTESDIN